MMARFVLTAVAQPQTNNFAPFSASYKYLDASGIEQDSPATTEELVGNETALNDTGASGGWYIVTTSTTNFPSRITVSGDIHLILADGSDVTIIGGIIIADTISGSGAGIGSGYNGLGGAILITGGDVTAQGGSDSAGIGGGRFGAVDTITINGNAVVDAKGGNSSGTAYGGGAGIGSGGGDSGGATAPNSGTITIGGTANVTATGGNSPASSNNAAGAGIGTGGAAGIGSSSQGINGGTITITGGTVTASSNDQGAGFGGGYQSHGGNITISGGTVTATGAGTAAGIGAGSLTGSVGAGENIFNILIYGESMVVNATKGAAAGTQHDIGKGNNNQAYNVFAALPLGNLKSGTTNIGNTVTFSATPTSTGTVTATLPSPFNAAPFAGNPYNLFTDLSTPKQMSVIATLGTNSVTFGLAGGYSNAVKTGAELMTENAEVEFGIPVAPTINSANNTTVTYGTGGTVTAATSKPYLAIEGETVTLTITPNAGYELISIAVYLYGTSTPVALSGSGLTRTFIMPAHHISVVAVFRLTGNVSIVETDNYPSLQAYVLNGVLHISGLQQGKPVWIYNILGTLIYQADETLTGFKTLLGFELEIPLPARGIYIITDGNTVVKVVN